MQQRIPRAPFKHDCPPGNDTPQPTPKRRPPVMPTQPPALGSGCQKNSVVRLQERVNARQRARPKPTSTFCPPSPTQTDPRTNVRDRSRPACRDPARGNARKHHDSSPAKRTAVASEGTENTPPHAAPSPGPPSMQRSSQRECPKAP